MENNFPRRATVLEREYPKRREERDDKTYKHEQRLVREEQQCWSENIQREERKEMTRPINMKESGENYTAQPAIKP